MTRVSLYLILLLSVFICAFFNGGNSAAVFQRRTSSLKECQPFICLLGDLDEMCEIRTKNNTTKTTCRHLMRTVCDQVEENDWKFINECHKGINKAGKKCTKCKAASKMCRAVVDRLPANVRSISTIIPNRLENLSQKNYWGRWLYRGSGLCRLCYWDNKDQWDYNKERNELKKCGVREIVCHFEGMPALYEAPKSGNIFCKRHI